MTGTSVENKALLEKYLADKSKKLLSKTCDKSRGETYYDFEDRVVETPDRQRQHTTQFRVHENGEVYMYRRVANRQRFLCVNGPLVGQKLTEENAVGYILFNRAGTWREPKKVPTAVLIHRDSLSLSKESQKKLR